MAYRRRSRITRRRGRAGRRRGVARRSRRRSGALRIGYRM